MTVAFYLYFCFCFCQGITSCGRKGMLNMRVCKHLLTTPDFVQRMRERPVGVGVRRSALESMHFDVLRILFLLLDHRDFLNFRLSCRAVFLASANNSVRSRVSYLALKQWEKLPAVMQLRLMEKQRQDAFEGRLFNK